MTNQTVSPVAGGEAIAQDLPKLKFKSNDRFLHVLKQRVDAYFDKTGRSRRDCPKMYFKTATILAWFVGAYLMLLFVAPAWWVTVPMAAVMGFAVAAIGFNIQHDGGHKAYSDHQWVNRLMSMTIEMVGGSSYFWDFKHNSIHHTYTNISGHDDDIDVGLLGRLSPQQPRYRFHRFQFIYLWFLYGFLAIKWNLFDDFYSLARGRIGNHKIPRPKGRNLAIFIGGKAVFFSIAFGIPMILHPFWSVVGIYCVVACVSGIVMSVVFQLAHCVKEAAFPVPVAAESGGQRVDETWAIHQVQTTVDFARGSRVLCWLLGGLNFQVEHHLFHKICHVHYPALSKIVEEACQEFGIQYNAHHTFLSALASHARFLFDMGRPTVNE